MELRIGDKVIAVERARLRVWFELESLRDDLRMAAERGDLLLVSDLLCAYLSAASGEPKETFAEAPWMDVAKAYVEIELLNVPRIAFPIFSDTVSKKEDELPWEYKGRTWYQWMHLLASAYSWSQRDIENLEIEDGIGMIQEIMVERQLEREWQYSLSEIAYPYDPSAKKSIFKPLHRPGWMIGKNVVKTTTLRKDMLPVGEIINLSGVGLHGQLVH